MIHRRKQFCKNGHDTFLVGRHTSGSCKLCMKVKQVENKDRHNLLNKEYKKRWPLKAREASWKNKGIIYTCAEYEKKLIEQNYSCAICLREYSEFKYNLCVDHNHKTGVIRGLLCVTCNRQIVGLIEENPEKLQRAKEYLDKWNGELKSMEGSFILTQTLAPLKPSLQ